MSKKNKKTLLRIEQRLIDIEVMVKILYNDKHFFNDITIADTGTPLPDSPYNISYIPDVPYNVSNTNEVRHSELFEPELGQMAFGQPWDEYRASNLLIAALESISTELDRVMWNIHQEEYISPFGNTASDFQCSTFEVDAYSWDDEIQPYNFKWRDVEVRWYKYLGRGTSVNQELSNDKIAEMLDDCLGALRKYEAENDV